MSFLGMGIGVFLNVFHSSTLAILTLIIFILNVEILDILIIQRQSFTKESLKSSKTFYFSNENLKNNKLLNNVCQIGYSRHSNILNSKWRKNNKHTLNSFLYNI